VRLSKTPKFERSYRKLTAEQKDAVNEALRLFMSSPRHPGLHFEKLGGSAYCTVRVNKGWRIVLRGRKGDYDLIDVGPHSVADSYA
jgi:plasmid maintenance system killer protein